MKENLKESPQANFNKSSQENNLKVFAFASGIAAEVYGAQLGVWDLFYSLQATTKFEDIFINSSFATKLQVIPVLASMYQEAHKKLATIHKSNNKYLFITGDHANGFGVWSGLAKVYQEDVGLIWVDAHLDSHTPTSSQSKNVHGMPVAHLLGYGDSAFTSLLHHKLKPENLAFIGTRSYEPEEIALLNKLGVKIFFMKDINEQNINEVFQQAVDHVSKNTNHFGISLDVDSMDPKEMPATGCFEPNGLLLAQVVQNLAKHTKNPKFKCLELTEFNPLKDDNRKTFNGILQILNSYFNNCKG